MSGKKPAIIYYNGNWKKMQHYVNFSSLSLAYSPWNLHYYLDLGWGPGSIIKFSRYGIAGRTGVLGWDSNQVRKDE